jgi:hypothetical protein
MPAVQGASAAAFPAKIVRKSPGIEAQFELIFINFQT